MLIYMLWTNR